MTDPTEPRPKGLPDNLTEYWGQYHQMVIPPQAPQHQILSTKNAFFAGALVTKQIMDRAHADGCETMKTVSSEILLEIMAACTEALMGGLKPL